MLEKMGLSFEAWVKKNMPDPFVLVLLLTLLTFAWGALLQPARANLFLLSTAWFDGFWKLLSFAMQMVLIVATGEAIVSTRPVKWCFARISEIPNSPAQALWILSSCALLAGWLHWGFGLVGSALLCREMVRVLERKNIHVDYPLMGVAAYMSMLLWHAGTTASAPLLINTPKHFLESKIGIVPLSQTIWLPSNLIACLALLLLIPWVIIRMHPRHPRKASEYIDPSSEHGPGTNKKSPKTLGDRLDQSAWIGRSVGILGLLTLSFLWARSGFDLTHNTVNFLLLSLGLAIHGSALSYAQAVSNSVRGTSGIILQFPFYGGIMGLMEGSGLGHRIADFFVGLSTAHTLPFFAYLASIVTKLFVPSGGGEWAVEGPVVLEAAKWIGSPVGKTTMGVAYGNMVGNLFQPFWAIPLLALLGLRARDIMGFCLVLFLFAFPILGMALLFSH